ncbi:flippase-like domain-containing protein [bacterium]|nr:flippase-like domain-containing protein [bacterium]
MKPAVEKTVSRFSPFFKRYSRVIRFTVVVILFSVLITKIHPSTIIDSWKSVRIDCFILGMALVIVQIIIQILKWNYILGVLDPRPSLRSVIMSLFGGFFLASVSPARTGEFIRGAWIPDHSPLRIASLTVVDKVFNSIVVLFFGFLSLTAVIPGKFALLAPLAGFILLACVFNIYRLKPLGEKILTPFLKKDTVDLMLTAFTHLRPGMVVELLIYSGAIYVIYVVRFYTLLYGFYETPAVTALKILPLVYFADLLLPFSFGDFGVKETASVALFGRYGISGGAAFSAAFTQNILTMLLPGLTGGIMIALSRFLPGRGVPSSTVHSTPS